MADFQKAVDLIRGFKGDRYIFGSNVLGEIGKMVAGVGRNAALVLQVFPGGDALAARVEDSLRAQGVKVMGRVQGAAPNAPREDVARMTEELASLHPDVIVCLGGGSTLDATKAASVLFNLGGGIDEYFGVGQVTAKLNATGRALTPVVAIQTAASSGAHLTKYANITDVKTGQKKLIVDEAIVPPRALFDYDVTVSMPKSLTADGALDAMSHALEVLYDSVRKPYYEKMKEVATETLTLVVQYLEAAIRNPGDTQARTALGLATDLGGYSIMLGGTNGAHLTSFSLVDILSHGRACAIMAPYYTVFFAPAIEEPLHLVGKLFRDAGLGADVSSLHGRELGIAVARAMMALSERIGFPTRLSDVQGFTPQHIERAMTAARDPQLKMKLQNMPVPLDVTTLDQYMRPILEAARDGDLSHVRNMA